MLESRQHYVFDDRELAVRLRNLESARNANARNLVRLPLSNSAAIEDDFTFRRDKRTGNQIEERAFASAVRSDETEQFPLLN